MIQSGLSENIVPLIVAVAGEIGNNSFDHNLGKWPDSPGVFFGFDVVVFEKKTNEICFYSMVMSHNICHHHNNNKCVYSFKRMAVHIYIYALSIDPNNHYKQRLRFYYLSNT